MGYMASGDVTVTITDEQKVALALLWSSEPGASGDIVSQVFAQAGIESCHESRESSDTTVYSGWFNDKWGAWIEEPLRLLAQAGAELTCQFRGEDDATWAIRSEMGSGVYQEESLVLVPQSRLAELERAAASAARLRSALTGLVPGQCLSAGKLQDMLDGDDALLEPATGPIAGA